MVQLVHGRLTDSRSSNNETRQGSVDCSCVSCHAASAKVDREEWIRSHFWGTCTEHLREREKEREDGRLTFTLISKEPSSPGPGAVARLCFSPYALIFCLLLDLLHSPPPCQRFRSRRVIYRVINQQTITLIDSAICRCARIPSFVSHRHNNAFVPHSRCWTLAPVSSRSLDELQPHRGYVSHERPRASVLTPGC